MNAITILIAIIQIVLQCAAAYFSYRIYILNKLSTTWLAMVVAFLLMALRRITAILSGIDIITNMSNHIIWIDKFLLPFLISVFLVVGIYSMLNDVEKSVVKKTKKKKK